MKKLIIKNKWNKDLFLQRCEEVHGREKFSYVHVAEKNIKDIWSLIPVICVSCRQEWQESIMVHLRRDKCPNQDCAKNKFRIKRYTLEVLLERGWQVHGIKYDYSENTEDIIKGIKSKIWVTCKICNYKWNPDIGNHINSGQGCPECSGRVPWTLERFLIRAKEIHGDKYDYSALMKEHVKGAKSKVNITCNDCKYQWSPSVHNHIGSKQGCPSCKGCAPWTLERFLIRAKEIHGDKYDYSNIRKDHIKRYTSKVPIICNECSYSWSTSIDSHINAESGCPNCVGLVKWTLERFLIRAKEIHGDKYDYSKVTEEHIQNIKSIVFVTCNICNYSWTPIIGNHINSGQGCPNCVRNVPWTLERFLIRAKEIHGDKYDYSKVTEKNINGNKSRLPLVCNKCNYLWNPTIDDHINKKHGCPDCGNVAPWTLERFLKKATKIHRDKFDYSQITREDIQGKYGEIIIICNLCKYRWISNIAKHINHGSGCPSCHSSKGEEKCSDILKLLFIEFTKEYIIKQLPQKRYDFFFRYNGKDYLLEFDGNQHFQNIPFFHRTIPFERRQETDIIKTRMALELGYYLIRIDYTQLDYIKEHIEKAFNSPDRLYVSTPEMYKYITTQV